MIGNFVSALFLSIATSAVSVHADMRIGSEAVPMESPHLVYPDTPQGHRYASSENKAQKRGGRLDVPPLMFGGGYAIGRIKSGFAVEARIAGDRIVTLPVPAELRDKDLTLYYGVCRIPIRRPYSHPELGPRILPHTQLNLSVVQWLIHDLPLSDYKVHFKGADLGICSTK